VSVLLFALLLLVATPVPAMAQTAPTGSNTQPSTTPTNWTPWRPAPPAPQNDFAAATRYRNDELGLRYWYSSGEISYDVSKPKISRLDYKVDNSQSGEMYFRFTNPQERYLFKGTLGFGGEQNGNVRDFDYNADGSTGSDTDSKLGKGRLSYGNADLGVKLRALSGTSASTTLFGGLGYIQDVMTARGSTCVQAGTPGAPNNFNLDCPSAGTVEVASNIKTLQNDAQWTSFRVGLENNFQPTQRLSWKNEVAFVPYASFWNGDSHYLRSDLGTSQPNIVDNGSGYGVQLESTLDYKITSRWSLNLGGRFWEFWVPDSTTKVGNPIVLDEQKAYSWVYQRLGVFGGVTYHF